MFSRWNFARSAEAMFSRWAIKRVCKFLLKKRLGELLLGDIDLDQLDVQLSRGTIQLSDLALNVDYLNQKLAGAAVIVKEGSIASLSIKIPWKLQNCQIEVEELELVLAPFSGSRTTSNADSDMSSHDSKQHKGADTEKIDLGAVPVSTASVSPGIHEGVKTIAKVVKWFLTSFHVRLRNLIVAYDPCLNVDEKSSEYQRSLVLRIAEIEYGTCVSEDVTANSNSNADRLLGNAKLTNFAKFHGAVIELLKMDAVDNQPQDQNGLGTSFIERYAGSSPSGSTATILTGTSGGFSGTLNLSIPWKNGYLDTRKVDADFSVDPVLLKLQPSTIESILVIWESIQKIGKLSSRPVSHKAADSFSSNSRVYSHSSMLGTSILGADTIKASRANLLKSTYPAFREEKSAHSLLPQTHVIHNWVPLSINEDETELEQDYGASVDQFFECFDGMRSSQANSGYNGIWNWTCSVFSAITVASNLASGSGHIPIEQHNVETSLRATVGEVSFFLSFHNEEGSNSHEVIDNNIQFKDPYGPGYGSLSTSNIISPESYMSCLSSMNAEHSTITVPDSISLNIHHVEARCQNLAFNLQICPQKTKFDASIMHFKVDEYYDGRNRLEGFGFFNYNEPYGHSPLNQSLQRQVLGVLPPFPVTAQEVDSERSPRCNAQKARQGIYSQDGLIKVGLLESVGTFSCKCALSSTDLDGRPMKSTSFSVDLPSFILWVDFHLVHMLLDLFKQVENYFERSSMSKEPTSDVLGQQHNSSFAGGVKSAASTYVTTVSPGASLQGHIALPQARVIFCFPSEFHGDFRLSTSINELIVLEHYPSSGMGKVTDTFQLPPKASSVRDSCTPSTSIYVGLGNFDIFLVNSATKGSLGDQIGMVGQQPFSSAKILSVTNRSDYHSGITMLWQKGPVTGPWMANRVWSLAATHDQHRNKVTGKGCEFSSVTAAEGTQETSSRIRQELILSSAFFVHAHFSCVSINLGNDDYRLLIHLLNQVSDGLFKGAGSTATSAVDHINNEQSSRNVSDPSQVSILVDCDLLDLCISVDDKVESNYSIQKELEGSWCFLRLKIEKLQLLSTLNIGGVNEASMFWLNHGEGELWGSVLDRNEVAQDLLLITCKDSSARRGDGRGVNALSFGSAGTAITYLWNPVSLQTYTSVILCCGTIIAPGGRLDWINAICSFFSLPPREESGNDGIQVKPSMDDEVYEGSFYLDLVDVALSYEPHMKCSVVNEFPDVEFRSCAGPSGETNSQNVACVLAAASLSLSNHTKANSETIDHKIRLQDVGLLITELSGSKNDNGCYHAKYLRKNGYVIVAQLALVQAVLRIKDLFWEVDCSDSHINLETCHDTTYGLVRLISQLQQLYAPDVEAAVAHLQSRWNSVQHTQDESVSNDMEVMLNSSSLRSSSERLPTNDEDCMPVGLLNEILENAFYMNVECKPPLDHFDKASHFSAGMGMPERRNDFKISKPIAGTVTPLTIPYEASTCSSGIGNSQKPFPNERCTPQIIESYCVSSRPSKLTLDNKIPSDHKCKVEATTRRDIESSKGGWYNEDSLMIVENHISKLTNQLGSKRLHHDVDLEPVDSDPVEDCKEKGRILLKNIDVRWRMYAGFDWSTSPCISNSHGRDESICLELTFAGLNLQYGIYPEGEISASKLSVSVEEFHLSDRSRDAPWKMVLGYYNSKGHRRESCAKAFKLDLETVRPDPLTPIEDYRLILEFLPMRLHLDQGQLNFLTSFFGNGSSVEDSQVLPNDMGASEKADRKSRTFGSQIVEEEALLPFFQKCDVRPFVLCVDYIPRHIDIASLRRGNYAELLNLVPWKGIDLQLKQVSALGVYGWSSVCETVVGQWLEDISHNQVHKLLKGIAPVRSLFAVSSGTSKLVSLPVKSYKKDKKILKGMQRGAIAFIKSISLEAVGLGVHLAAGAHDMLLQTEYILTSVPPSVPERSRIRAIVRSNQPEDTQQGFHQAYESISDGLGRTASALIGAPLKAYQRGAGVGSALATAVRAAPAAAIAPVAASARAVHCTLLGVRNSLDPDHKKESMEKYLGPSWS